MANRKALKQRKKRKLKRAFKQVAKRSVTVVKPTAPATPVNLYGTLSPDYIPPYQEPRVDTQAKHIERTKAYQNRLDSIYGGTVTALISYVNDKSTMTCKCNSCGLVFFGKAGHIVGKDHQRHECGMPYGTVEGERFHSVSAIKQKRTKKSKKPSIDVKQFQELIWNDNTPEQIAKELQINPNIIKDYFVTEGLIEEPPTEVKKDELTYFDSSKFGRKSFKDSKGRLFLDCPECKEVRYSDDFKPIKNGFHGKASKCKGCESNVNKQRNKRLKG
jgi:hypothetical protein